MTCRLRWCVEMETRCRIPIWRKFGRIQWHVIPEPRITLQGATTLVNSLSVTIPEPHATFPSAVTWRNQCRDRATLQGVRIPSAILKIVFRHILFFLFLILFRLWRAMGFVSSLIHLYLNFLVKIFIKSCIPHIIYILGIIRCHMNVSCIVIYIQLILWLLWRTFLQNMEILGCPN